MSDAAAPEPDRLANAPHPRDTPAVLGQSVAEAQFLDAFNSGRLHHGWLITGPRGVGKATLAWRIARFLRTQPTAEDAGMFAPPVPETLDSTGQHPALAQIQAGSDPGLFVLRRPVDPKTNRLRQEITVDEVRRLISFFQLAATDGGRRVVIIDSADEMNVQAANALLKLLEEPPARTTLLLLSHQPARILPTIRSRCRSLRCLPLSPADLQQALAQTGADVPANADALAALTAGSVGDALRLIHEDGLDLYGQIVAVLATLPQMDRTQALALADSVAGRGQEARFELMLWLLDLCLSRLARSGLPGQPLTEAAPGEAALFARLAPDAHHARRWADLHQKTGARLRHGRAVNLDPAALILDTLVEIRKTAT